MKKLFGKPRGQVLVMYSIGLAALLAALALCTDVAVMYVNWQQLQKAADAAVISGAGKLNGLDSTGDTNAVSTATTYGSANGILSTDTVTGPTVTGHTSITMTVSRTVPYLFGQVLGLHSAPVQVTATAQIEPITGAGGTHLVPFGFVCGTPPCSDAAVGDTFALPGDSDRLSPGNWGGLNFGDQDTTQGYTGSHYETAIENGYGGTTPILTGTTDIHPVTGNDVNVHGGPGVEDRYNAGTEVPDASDPSVLTNPNDSRVIVIPMVASFPSGNSADVDITGFITALIIPEPGQGSSPTQFFAQVVSSADSSDIASSSGPVTGTTFPVLTK
jgi:Flp pilus assembly protein TadG